jgi:hypothetical protein
VTGFSVSPVLSWQSPRLPTDHRSKAESRAMPAMLDPVRDMNELFVGVSIT